MIGLFEPRPTGTAMIMGTTKESKLDLSEANRLLENIESI